jgi:hypothetical protein
MSDDLLPHPNVVIKLSLCLHMCHEIDVDDKSYIKCCLITLTCLE